jgi:adenylate kinase
LAKDALERRPELIHLSTGNMLREALANETPVGKEAKRFMDAGELVPDQIVMKIVAERLSAGPQNAQYLLDGVPRTDEQAHMLDEYLNEGPRGTVPHVFLLEVDTDLIVARIAGRLMCRDCGAVFHILNMPPKVEGVCDLCGGELYHRDDDTRETVLNRLDVYNKQTAGLIDYYEQRGVLRRVDGVDRQKAVDAMLAYLQSA